MQQVLVIHGGGAYPTYERFIEVLAATEIELEVAERRDWKKNLREALGAEFTVILPQMPNKQNAKFSEWKLWFDKHLPLLDDRLILVGHSLGGCFLAKYLSEYDFPKTITATLLVAAPYREDGDFAPSADLGRFARQGGRISLWHSKDDKVVAFSEMEQYAGALPAAQTHAFEDRGHFTQEQFPEIVQELRRFKAL